MKEIPDGSIDMVFADLPYGITCASWDSVIPMALLWPEYERVIKDNGALCFTSNQPFTSMLIFSKLAWFRCEWIWNKENVNNFGNANIHPLKQHETIVVFGKKRTVYYPQKIKGKINHSRGDSIKNRKSEANNIDPSKATDDFSGMKYPKTIITIPKHASQCKYHPTEKPVALMEYFIKTYSLEGETVLDNTMGSGSTGVACINTGRDFIGIEKDEKYFKIAKNRIREAIREKRKLSGGIK